MPAQRVVLIADVDVGALQPSILDLAAVAQRIADQDGGEVCWLAVGRQVAAAAAKLAEETGYPVTALEIPPNKALTGELAGKLLQPLLAALKPDLVALRHTTHSQDFAAALALALGAACIYGVQGIVTQNHEVCFQRAVFGGRLLAEIQTDGRPAVVTVLPGYFKHAAAANASAAVDTQRPPIPVTRTRLVATRKVATQAALTQAEVIVAAGRGIGAKENLTLVEKLATRFPRSAVAGSRIICDAGWMGYERQVGVTGATVAPKLYLACGISGAPQHVSGMQGAELIVAVNKDSRAVIFNVADIGVVEDLEVFLPLLIEALGGLQSASTTDAHR